MSDEFPPKVPCPGSCEYGACGDPGIYAGPYGCGGCCRCMGGCRIEYEVEQAYIPETKQQADMRRIWEAIPKGRVRFAERFGEGS